MAMITPKKSYKWTTEATRALIHFRAVNDDMFIKSKDAPRKLWTQFIEEAGLVGKVKPQQAGKKWENLKRRYKTGSGTDGGELTAATWQYYDDMHEVLGGWVAIEPPLLVASFTPHEDFTPTAVLMDSVDGPSSSSSASSTTSASAVDLSSCRCPSRFSTPSPPRKKKKKNPVLEFLREESAREQRRHEEEQRRHDEREHQTERFLKLFEKLVEKL